MTLRRYERSGVRWAVDQDTWNHFRLISGCREVEYVTAKGRAVSHDYPFDGVRGPIEFGGNWNYPMIAAITTRKIRN